MNRGEIVWMTPNGDGPRNHPAIRHLNLGPLGTPGRPAPLLTKTLLFLAEGSTNLPGGGRVMDGMPPEIVTNYGGRWFRAYGKATGDVVWQVELAAGSIAPPVTYHVRRQAVCGGVVRGRRHARRARGVCAAVGH